MYPQYTCLMKGANENDTFPFHNGHHFLNRAIITLSMKNTKNKITPRNVILISIA